MTNNRALRPALACLLAIALPAVDAQSEARFGQYQAMLTMRDFFQQKIVDNHLYRAIEFQDVSDCPVPTFEAYHESDVWEYDKAANIRFGNLRAGARLFFKAGEIAGEELGLGGFFLMDFSFLSSPSGNIPVLEVPFPYIMSMAESAKELMPGLSLSWGDPVSPALSLSIGQSFPSSEGSADYGYFEAVDPIGVLDLRSPRYGVFFQVFKNGQEADFASGTAVSFGIQANQGAWVSDWLAGRHPLLENLYDALRLEWLANQLSSAQAGGLAHFGVTGFKDILDFDFALKHDGARGLRTDWWRIGARYSFVSDRTYSSIYKTKLDLKAGATFSNVRDFKGIFLYPFNNADYSGAGFYAEAALQNPFLQTLDIFDVLLKINLIALQSVSGVDASATQEELAAKIFEIAHKEQSGGYDSNFFDRITIGFEVNDPQALAVHGFTLDQLHVYVNINVFI